MAARPPRSRLPQVPPQNDRVTIATTSQSLLGGTVQRTVLPSGLRVLTEQVPGVRSAAIGVWVGVGSRDEAPGEAGASHYLEHLLFKGTAARSALDISATLEAVGGELNAFTSREHTCYYARVLDRDLPLAVDVVSDMVTASLLREDDVEAERGVILEEIAMHEDDPADLVHDVFSSAALGDGPLGRPVLGTAASIATLQRTDIADYYRVRYVPSATVIAISGALDHADALAAVTRAWESVADTKGEPLPTRRGARRPYPGRGVRVSRRSSEQAHLILGTAGVSRHDERRYALGLLSSSLGEGMSSRLFQEIREKRGLAYSVYSFASHYADTGLFGIYAGVAPKRAAQVLTLCREQLEMVATGGITAEELERAKGQARGSLALGLEDTGARMSRLGKSELAQGEVLSVDETLERIDAVSLADVTQIAADVLGQPLSLGAVGPFDVGELADAVA
jgi:predicted Zn-dependent peptidase